MRANSVGVGSINKVDQLPSSSNVHALLKQYLSAKSEELAMPLLWQITCILAKEGKLYD